MAELDPQIREYYEQGKELRRLLGGFSSGPLELARTQEPQPWLRRDRHPELSIAAIATRRHEGIGRRLLMEIIDASVAQGHAALSLSVNDGNPARGLYESVGFG